MLPKETLDLIQQTACKAEVAQVLGQLNTDGRTAYVQLQGEIKQISLAPRPRTHTVRALHDLIMYAVDQHNKKPVVWHGETGVVLVLDDDDRRDEVNFPLTLSQRFCVLAKLADDPQPLSQQEFVRLLRRDLGLDTSIVAKFRKLDWSNGGKASSEINPQNARLSKSIIAECNGVGELPEELFVQVPVYRESGERTEYTVRCYIDIDAVNQRFGFGPLPDELPRIVDLAQADIRKRLEGGLGTSSMIPVFYGTP